MIPDKTICEKIMIFLFRTRGPIDMTHVSKNVHCTYSCTIRNLCEMETRGHLTSVKKGRVKIVSLTEKGKLIAAQISKLDKMIGDQIVEG